MTEEIHVVDSIPVRRREASHHRYPHLRVMRLEWANGGALLAEYQPNRPDAFWATHSLSPSFEGGLRRLAFPKQ